MEFKEFVELNEAGSNYKDLKVNKPGSAVDKGATRSDQEQGRVNVVGNASADKKVSDKLSTYLGKVESPRLKKAIADLGLATPKGGMALMNFFQSVFNNITTKPNGDKYDFRDPKDAHMAKRNLQQRSKIYTGLFYAIPQLMSDGTIDNEHLSMILRGLKEMKTGLNLPNADAKELFVNRKKGDKFVGKANTNNEELQQTFDAFVDFASGKGTDALWDVYGSKNLKGDELDGKSDDELMTRKGKYPHLADFAKNMTKASTISNTDDRTGAKSKSVDARDRLMVAKAEEMFADPSKKVSDDEIKTFLDIVVGKDGHTGGGGDRPLEAMVFTAKDGDKGNLLSKLADYFQGTMDKTKAIKKLVGLIKQFGIDIDVNKLTALSKQGASDIGLGEEQPEDKLMGELINNVIPNSDGLSKVKKWIVANMVNGTEKLTLTNDNVNKVVGAIEKRMANRTPVFKGFNRFPANDQSVKNMLRQLGWYNTTSESEDLVLGFRTFLAEKLEQ